MACLVENSCVGVKVSSFHQLIVNAHMNGTTVPPECVVVFLFCLDNQDITDIVEMHMMLRPYLESF